MGSGRPGDERCFPLGPQVDGGGREGREHRRGDHLRQGGGAQGDAGREERLGRDPGPARLRGRALPRQVRPEARGRTAAEQRRCCVLRHARHAARTCRGAVRSRACARSSSSIGPPRRWPRWTRPSAGSSVTPTRPTPPPRARASRRARPSAPRRAPRRRCCASATWRRGPGASASTCCGGGARRRGGCGPSLQLLALATPFALATALYPCRPLTLVLPLTVATPPCQVGFTLRGDHDFTLAKFHFKAPPELFHPYYGEQNDARRPPPSVEPQTRRATAGT